MRATVKNKQTNKILLRILRQKVTLLRKSWLLYRCKAHCLSILSISGRQNTVHVWGFWWQSNRSRVRACVCQQLTSTYVNTSPQAAVWEFYHLHTYRLKRHPASSLLPGPDYLPMTCKKKVSHKSCDHRTEERVTHKVSDKHSRSDTVPLG